MKGYKQLFRRAAALVAISLGMLHHAWAQEATLDDIRFASLPGNDFEVQLEFSGAPPEPRSYSVDEPARVVFDFEGVKSALKERRHSLEFENARSAVVLTAGNRTRLILNLNRSVAYTADIAGNVATIRVGGDGRERAVEAATASRPASDARGGRRAITDVDFSRNEEGEGLVSLNLSDPNISVDTSKTGNRIKVNFYRTDLPESLDRRLNVVDFATPIKTVDTTMDGSTTTVTIEAQGAYDYMAYQADDRYVISVRPLAPEEEEARGDKFPYTGEKLSLNFQDIEVRSVLQLIADFTDLNLVASDTVRGNITLRLQNVPWDQALDIVLKSKGLDKRLQGNVLMVGPAAEIAERERLQVEANKQLEELAPLVTDFIRVRYADAGELFSLFRGSGGGGGGRGGTGRESLATGSVLSERGSAIVDERTNTIIITDTEEKLAAFRRLVDRIDIPIRQVEIEARIVIANTSFLRELGVRWGAQGLRQAGGNPVAFGGSLENFGDDVGSPFTNFGPDPGQITVNEETLAVDLGVSNPAGSFALALLTDDTFLDLELSALENAGYGEIVSQPKVMTGDKQTAVIKSGEQIPYQEATSAGATNIQFKDAVLSLEVTPQITPDNRVILDLVINQDSVGQRLIGNEPSIDITEIQTQALIGDGQTLVLGGIFQMEESTAEDKVPFLGDIPYLGRLFKRDLKSREKREILIFVTPKIIEDQLLNR